MKIIALDQSSTATGVSLFNNGELVNYILIKPKSSKKTNKLLREYDLENHIYTLKMPEDKYDITLLRITAIVDTIELILNKERPDYVYFEEVYLNNNAKGFRSLSRLQGFIAHLCHSLRIPYRIVEESKWISSWGEYSTKVKRKERKEDIMKKVNDYYNLNITVDDLSDSIALGRYATQVEK